MIKRTKIKVETPQSLCWQNELLVDLSSGHKIYQLDGEVIQAPFRISYLFDSAKTNQDGSIAVIYQKLGTKGLIYKNGEMLKEINRSFYQAHVYEYPVAIFTLQSGQNLLFHCPDEYCRLEIEDIDTGEILSKSANREDIDCFFSRLEINENYLLSAGWVWHPYNVLSVYKLSDALAKPESLDDTGIGPETDGEVTSARFYGEKKLIVTTDADGSEEVKEDSIAANKIAYFNLETGQVEKQIQPSVNFGNALALDDDFVLDLVEYPKVLNMNTGKVEASFEDIPCGNQQSPIIWHLKDQPAIAINHQSNKIAIATKEGIEILEFKK